MFCVLMWHVIAVITIPNSMKVCRRIDALLKLLKDTWADMLPCHFSSVFFSWIVIITFCLTWADRAFSWIKANWLAKFVDQIGHPGTWARVSFDFIITSFY
jgi:hypothetical protein